MSHGRVLDAEVATRALQAQAEPEHIEGVQIHVLGVLRQQLLLRLPARRLVAGQDDHTSLHGFLP